MRDARLDFWRGLCLLDMVLVHLVHEGVWLGDGLTPAIADWTRFAAGGFVLVAGLGVARVFGVGLDDAARRERSYRRLRLRAAYLLGVHYAAAAAFVLLDVVLGRRPPPESVPRLLANVLLLQEAPPYGDVLPLYVAMLLVAPALLGLVRRGLGGVVLAASALVFAVGLSWPHALGPAPGSRFPIAPWQYVFVVGLLAGFALPRWDAAPRALRLTTLAGLGLGAAVLTVAAFEPAAWAAAGLAPIHFEKVPLNLPELGRYLLLSASVGLATSVAWPLLAPLRVVALVRLLGRRSLAVYVSHVFVQAILVAVTLPWVASEAHGLALAGAALVTLLGIAAGLERWDRAERRAPARALRLPRGLVAIPSGAVAAALLLAAVVFVPPPPFGAAGPEGIEALVVDAPGEPALEGDAFAPALDEPLGEDAEPGADPAAETSQRLAPDVVA